MSDPSSHSAKGMQALRLMLMTLGAICLGLSVVAYAWGGQSPWAVADPEDLLRTLRMEGMDCQPRPDQPQMFDCLHRPLVPLNELLRVGFQLR